MISLKFSKPRPLGCLYSAGMSSNVGGELCAFPSPHPPHQKKKGCEGDHFYLGCIFPSLTKVKWETTWVSFRQLGTEGVHFIPKWPELSDNQLFCVQSNKAYLLRSGKSILLRCELNNEAKRAHLKKNKRWPFWNKGEPYKSTSKGTSRALFQHYFSLF